MVKAGHLPAPAQIAVDEPTSFIGAAYLSDETNDRKEFEKIHEQNEANPGPDDQRHYTADSGYHSYAQLEYVQANDVDAVIAEPKPADRDGQSKDSGKLSRGLAILAARLQTHLASARLWAVYLLKSCHQVAPVGPEISVIRNCQATTLYSK